MEEEMLVLAGVMVSSVVSSLIFQKLFYRKK